MILYRTLKEIAEEWDVSLRHLQYLCSKGRIDGAIKKAGVWFIPNTVPPPVRYTKGRNEKFDFAGTKKRIFNCAIQLFQSKGYEAVSMKDIAEAAGITQSSVYNHFQSKQKILNTIYDFYYYYYLRDRPHLEDIEPILQSGSLQEIVSSVRYKFGEDHLAQMADITAIIFHRSVIDDRAHELTRSLMIDEGIRYVESILERAVEIGRLAPMDTRRMALLINSIRIFTLHRWLSSSDRENTAAQFEEDEFQLDELISKLLTDLKFRDDNGK